MILEMQHVFKNYIQGEMEVPVLKDINFSVDEGEYIAITGPSGSGKTTMMNLIGCLDVATKGKVIFDGDDVGIFDDNRLSELRLRKIGFVFQHSELLGSMTAIKNVMLPLMYAGVEKEQREARAREALGRVGLSDRLHFRPNQLSGGQRQRVAVARAIINHPKILLADEPTGALDSASGEAVMQLFESLNDEGITIIMINHDSKIASRARRRAQMLDGVLKEETDGSI
ncbi:MAG: ABC transporter ATP-binding protein [Lachnospiraceae bacterium]|nr:ABC transporter ATP-binding protein [Lachnospiraceae bacterium]